MIYYFIILLIIVVDRIIKTWISSNMQIGESIPIINEFFHITYIHNEGAAFSLMEGQWLVLILFPMMAIMVGLLILFIKRRKWNRVLLSSISLICAGGIGNLIDRVILGYVIDFFDFRVFPIFNIADISICIGCALLLIDTIILDRKRGKNVK